MRNKVTLQVRAVAAVGAVGPVASKRLQLLTECGFESREHVARVVERIRWRALWKRVVGDLMVPQPAGPSGNDMPGYTGGSDDGA